MITSTQNSKIKALRKLQKSAKDRREASAFVVEGVRLVEEAIEAEWSVKSGIYTEQLSERGKKVLAQLIESDTKMEMVSPEVMAAASDTKTPQGLLLELALQEGAAPELIDLVLIADALHDPGNLGSLLRSAAAAGVDSVLLAPGSADAFGPKVLRSGMGAHFQIAIRKMSWSEISSVCTEHNLQILLTAAGEGAEYSKADLTQPLALIVSGEAQGASEEARALATETLHIAMPGKMESLNVATAGSLFLFEALRQRKNRDS